jgi:hypothetical protein
MSDDCDMKLRRIRRVSRNSRKRSETERNRVGDRIQTNLQAIRYYIKVTFRFLNLQVIVVDTAPRTRTKGVWWGTPPPHLDHQENMATTCTASSFASAGTSSTSALLAIFVACTLLHDALLFKCLFNASDRVYDFPQARQLCEGAR